MRFVDVKTVIAFNSFDGEQYLTRHLILNKENLAARSPRF